MVSEEPCELISSPKVLKLNALWWVEGLGPPHLASSHPHPFILLTKAGEGDPYRGSYKALVVFPRSEISWQNVHWATREPLLSDWEVWALPKASGPLSQPDDLKEYHWLHDTAGLLTCVCMFVLGCVHNSEAGLRLSKAPCLVGNLDQYVTERDNFHNGF